MSWHVPVTTVRAYLDGTTPDADAWSVEAHLMACDRCRALLAAEADAVPEVRARVDEGWQAIATELPVQGRLRRGSRVRQVYVLAAAGPAARWAWFTASVVVLALAAGIGAVAPWPHGGDLPLLGLVAPLVPILGVAVAYGSGLDDTHEVIASTPGGGLRLLLIRSGTVLALSTVIALVAGAVSGYGSPVPWLLASLSLVVLVLALGSVTGMIPAAAIVTGGWIVAVTVNVLTVPSNVVPIVLGADLAPVWLAVAGCGAAVVALRRDAFDQIALPARHR